MRNYEQELENRVAFIRQLLKESGCEGIVYGNSGGKDSALVGILCKKACGNTVGILLPISFLSYTDQTQGITLKGFVYNVENFTLKKGSTRCISNEICDEKAAVSFTNGLLYCIRSRDLR